MWRRCAAWAIASSRRLPRPTLDPWRSRQARRMDGAVSFSGGEGVAGGAPLRAPLTEVDRATAQLDQVLLLGAIAALLVAVLMSSAGAQLASRGTRQLTVVARRMAGG